MEKTFVGGLYPKKKRDNAPDFIISVGSINHKQMIEFCQKRLSEGEEWTNWQAKQPLEATKKPYAEIDTWKPEKQRTVDSVQPEDIPVIEVEDVKIEDVPF